MAVYDGTLKGQQETIETPEELQSENSVSSRAIGPGSRPLFSTPPNFQVGYRVPITAMADGRVHEPGLGRRHRPRIGANEASPHATQTDEGFVEPYIPDEHYWTRPRQEWL